MPRNEFFVVTWDHSWPRRTTNRRLRRPNSPSATRDEGADGLSIEGVRGGGGVDSAPWLAPPPPPKRGSIDRTPKILLRLTPGPRR